MKPFGSALLIALVFACAPASAENVKITPFGSHAGATTGGKVRSESRTATFTNLVKGRPVYPALSGKTMEFDGGAKCIAGC